MCELCEDVLAHTGRRLSWDEPAPADLLDSWMAEELEEDLD